MGRNECVWICWGAGGVSNKKTDSMGAYGPISKETNKNKGKRCQCEACTWWNQTGRWQGCVWCSERVIRRNLGITSGVRCEMEMHMQIWCRKQTTVSTKTKTSELKMTQPADLQRKWSKHETSQKQQYKLNNNTNKAN